VRRSLSHAGAGSAKKVDPGTDYHLFGRAGSHQADGVGRTWPRTAVCHPGTEADCDSATGAGRHHHRDPVVPGPQRHHRQREADEWAKGTAGQPGSRGTLPRSLANFKGEILEEKGRRYVSGLEDGPRRPSTAFQRATGLVARWPIAPRGLPRGSAN